MPIRTAARLALASALSLTLVAAAGASAASPTPALSPAGGAGWATSVEAPALARPGPHRVGTTRITVRIEARPVVTDGKLSLADFDLPVRLFYPAGPGGQAAVYQHTIRLPKEAAYTVIEHGLAFAEAAQLAGGTFPLVVVSHGFGGWDTHFSRLCELVASHGYVVAALDHGDAYYDDVPGFLASFGQVLMARPHDQRTVITALLARARAHEGPLALVNPAQPVGLVGYSMGGYGALGTAGADYDAKAATYATLPKPAREALAAPSPVSGRIGALALLAPWGAQPDSRIWTPAALEQVHAPVLLIDGDQDDVVNYTAGVRWLFGALRATDRHLLTLHEAKHNIAGNQVDLPASASADLLGYFREAVWRQERINQVTSHFLIAFLDGALKHDAAARRHLDVPTEESDAGQWPVRFGELTGGTLAGDGQPGYWRGFPRGWAIGMRLERREKGE